MKMVQTEKSYLQMVLGTVFGVQLFRANGQFSIVIRLRIKYSLQTGMCLY